MTGEGGLRLATLNLASGRAAAADPRTPSASLDAADLATALAALSDVDVLALQEVDVAQPRSHLVDQVAVAAAAIGSDHAAFAPALVGTPGPQRTWTPSPPVVIYPEVAGDLPRFGVALVSRRPVHRWHVLRLEGGRGRLPLPAQDPETGRRGVLLFPDEPRVALAAELDGLTVVTTHLSFWPTTALRQLREVRHWLTRLPGPVVLAGDLNLHGAVPGRVLGARALVTGPTYPAHRPRLQLDHLLLLGTGTASGATTTELTVGDHRCAAADLVLGPA